MKFIELKQALRPMAIFSLNDIRKVEPSFYRTRLNEWQDKGYIKKIVREYYLFSDVDIDEPLIFSIANRIYGPSYISFESALSFHQLIPESVYAITSATTRRTYRFETPVGEFRYRKIKPGLFWGYRVIRIANRNFRIAAPEKALLDFFYLNSHLTGREDFESLRINSDQFNARVDKALLGAQAERFASRALFRRINSLLRFLEEES